MFYLTTHSTHFNNGTTKTTLDKLGMSNIWISQNFLSVHSLSKQIEQRQYDQYLQICKNTISLFNDALNTFYLRLYGVGHMAKDHSDNERKSATATWATLSD